MSASSTGSPTELARLDPAGGPDFTANADRLIARLKGLDAEFRDGLAGCRGRDIVLAGHSRLRLPGPPLRPRPDGPLRPEPRLPAQAAATSSRPSTSARKKGIKTVYFENSVAPDLSRTLAREIGGRVLVLYAGHNLTRDEQAKGVGFFDLMEKNLASLREGLGCR